MLLSILFSINFLTVFCAVTADSSKPSEHEPQVAFWCGKVNQHIDLKTGQWVTDKNGKSMCATDKEQVLRYCKHTYPSIQIKNIVESNSLIAIKNWCDPYNVNCTANKEVITYRCLVGPFEADALLVPKGCRFGHLHKGSKCKSHDIWRSKAEDKCHDQGMKLKNYGVLIPCGTGVFTGVEYVCCPKNMAVEKPKEHPIMRLIGGREDVDVPKLPTEHPTSLIEKLEKEIKKYPKHLFGNSIGCDHTKYHRRRQKMELEHRNRMSNIIKEWEKAEQRYNALKNEDPIQAEEMISGVMDRFKKIVAVLEKQAKLERMNLHEEHVQCMQIDLNDKKNKVLRSFLKALKKTPPDENAILKAMRKFMNVSTEDRIHNHHHFERMIKNNPDNADQLRKNFQAHLKHINEKVNQTMTLLYKVPKIARKFILELPSWVPTPKPLPTEKPTTEATTEPAKEKEEKVKERKENKVKHHQRVLEHHGGINHVKNFLGMAAQKKHPKLEKKDGEPEDEEYFEKPQSPATFAIVIGLSCGALVIMIVIIIAMAMRKSRGNNPTRTVLVDPDADDNSEKQHLANLQENGYENPIYKFTSY